MLGAPPWFGEHCRMFVTTQRKASSVIPLVSRSATGAARLDGAHSGSRRAGAEGILGYRSVSGGNDSRPTRSTRNLSFSGRIVIKRQHLLQASEPSSPQ